MGESNKRKLISPMASWCFLRDSQRLKTIIRAEMQVQEIGVRELGRRIGTGPDRISNYLNSNAQRCTQHHVISICKELGLDVDLIIRKKDFK